VQNNNYNKCSTPTEGSGNKPLIYLNSILLLSFVSDIYKKVKLFALKKNMTKKIIIFVISIIVCWTGIAYSQIHTSRHIIQKLSMIKQHEPTFDIKLWTNQETYQPNKPIKLFFRAYRDCYLILINVDAEGVVRIIFPNPNIPDNFIQAYETYNISRDFNLRMKAGDSSGFEHVKAIVTTRKMDISEIAFHGRKYFFFEEADSFIAVQGIESLLRTLKKQKEWTETSFEFEIKDDGASKKRWAMTGKKDFSAPKSNDSSATIQREDTEILGLGSTQ
jgi:hypothetical protein